MKQIVSIKQDLHGSCFSQGETLREQVGIAAQRTAGLNATRVGHTQS
ncbi:MAG: hypothetical protein V7L11_09055 [Nostoc sp.]